MAPGVQRGGSGGGGTTAATNRRQEQAAQAAAEQEELRQLRNYKQFEVDCKGWCGRISSQAGKKFFHMRQFFSCPEDQQFGSTWQKIICDWLSIPDEEVEAFWTKNSATKGGKKCAHKTISIRRMNVTNAIKTRFEGK